MMLEEIRTEVLIIGSGGAGLRAAVAAAQAGRKTLVVSKASAGRGTSTLISYGVLTGHAEGYGPGRHGEQTLAAGRGINQSDLVEALVAEAPDRLQELLAWGLPADVHQGYLVSQGRPLALGAGLINCLLTKAGQAKVEFLAGLQVARIAPHGSGISVYAWHEGRRRWLLIRAAGVVLASGGLGGLYLRHDNPGRMLGEGYALALEAGAALQDLEFVQFFPLLLAEPGRPKIVISSPLEHLGRLVNDQGQDILAKHGINERPAAEKARDKLSQALHQEIEVEGRTVFLDLRRADRKAWAEHPFSAPLMELLLDRCQGRERPLKVAPTAHFFMGGVSIDPFCRTGVPGLLASGEAAGGLHGANRLGGNALTETVVFGARAGETAAAWARENPLAGTGPEPEAPSFPDLSEASRPETGSSSAAIMDRLKRTMWRQAGVVRDREGLEEASARVAGLRNDLEELFRAGRAGPRDRILELRGALDTAGLIIAAALRREESRGAHFRSDFPAQDDNRFLGRWKVRLDENGRPKWWFEGIRG
jgi:succinate dehydrogenase/fumarate reductase flavoprotein subunit